MTVPSARRGPIGSAPSCLPVPLRKRMLPVPNPRSRATWSASTAANASYDEFADDELSTIAGFMHKAAARQREATERLTATDRLEH